MKIQSQGIPRLSIHRTSQHIYAQLIILEPAKEQSFVKVQKVVASASSLDKELKSVISHGGNIATATKVGELIAQRIKAAGITKVAFDRSGYKYHGRVKALADAARAGGVDF